MPLAFKYFIKWRTDPGAPVNYRKGRKSASVAVDNGLAAPALIQNSDEGNTINSGNTDSAKLKLEKSKSSASVTTERKPESTAASTDASATKRKGSTTGKKAKKSYDSDSD
jgi:hypothetical protein